MAQNSEKWRQLWEAQPSDRMTKNEPIPRHILVKLQNIKKNLLKAAREKKLPSKGITIRLTKEFQSAAM